MTAIVAAASAPALSADKPALRETPHDAVIQKTVAPSHGRHKTVTHKVATKAVRKVARRTPAIGVPMDEVRVVAFSQPISTVYVGNPSIADVSVIDSRHAFVLGKAFGGTNIVALDADGKQVVNEQVSVYGRAGSTVILHRGAGQVTYACAASRCESAPTPGDEKDVFSARMDQVEKHQDMGMKAASAGH